MRVLIVIVILVLYSCWTGPTEEEVPVCGDSPTPMLNCM